MSVYMKLTPEIISVPAPVQSDKPSRNLLVISEPRILFRYYMALWGRTQFPFSIKNEGPIHENFTVSINDGLCRPGLAAQFDENGKSGRVLALVLFSPHICGALRR